MDRCKQMMGQFGSFTRLEQRKRNDPFLIPRTLDPRQHNSGHIVQSSPKFRGIPKKKPLEAMFAPRFLEQMWT